MADRRAAHSLYCNIYYGNNLIGPAIGKGLNFKMVFNVQRQLAMRRRGRSYGTLARQFATVAGAGYGIASRTKNWLSGKKKTVETPAVTNQYDVKTMYRRKRMPRRKRRGWMRFKKKVLSAENSLAAKQCLVFRRVVNPQVAANSQSVVSAMLYGNGESFAPVDLGCEDMKDCWDAWYNENLVSDNGTPGKLNFTSGVLDIELGNVGGEGYANSLTVDVYHVRCKRQPMEIENVSTYGFAALFNAALGATTMPNMSSLNTVNLDDDQAGVTPFCAPLFCKYVEVLSVKKVLLSVGQNTHFQLRLSRDWIYNNIYQQRFSTALRKGVEGYLFIVQGVTTASQFSAPCNYVLNATRTYHFRVNEANKIYGGLAITSS